MATFVHEFALCESTAIGPGTRIWAFAHVLPGARVGADCNICDHVFIENDVVLGDRVTVKCGVQLWDGVRLGDDVFVGPNATFTNDPFPRSKHFLDRYPETVVCDGASIGAAAVLLPGIRIGRQAMVGAGAVVTHDVPPNSIVVGNPARIVGYVGTPPQDLGLEPIGDLPTSVVEGVTLVRLNQAADLRGSLVAAEFTEFPFTPKRVFTVFDVPSRDVRGEHAHRACQQLLVCLRGSVSAVVDDGTSRQEYLLDHPSLGLYMPAMTWGTQYRYSPDAVLLVLASEAYDADDYIRDYETFLELVASR
jgi:acetyltransferase-like isoleucine patch superfamily enzyme/dTDP-4-dehydrorhamnose 3,5-epimerase-like enzyme